MLFLLMGKEPYDGEWYPEEVFEDIDEARAAAKDLEAYDYETNIETIPFWTAGSYYEYQKKAEKETDFLKATDSLGEAINKCNEALKEKPEYDFSGVKMVK